MREGWVETTLGELTTQVRDSVKVEPDQKYTLLGVSGKGKGAFIKEAVTSKTSKAKSFYRAVPGHFIYNRLFAGNGSFGIVPESDVELFVSNEFPLFRADPYKLETEYLQLTFENPSMWSHVELQCVGSTGSRMRWTEDKFGATKIALPPLAEQRRIVDVIESVDTYIAALEKRAETARTARSALLHDLLSNPGPDWIETTIGEIAFVNPETATPTSHNQRFRYVDLSSVSASTGIDIANLDEYDFDTAPGRARRVIRSGDVLISTVRPYLRGFATVPQELDLSIASTGFTVLRPVDSISTSGFLWASIRTNVFVDFLMGRATGSNYPAVRANDISEFPIVLPPLEEQRRIVDVTKSVDENIARLEISLSKARNFRAALLSDLLSGNHEIPASYDQLLGAA